MADPDLTAVDAAMARKKDDGGSAFPYTGSDSGIAGLYPGMSLRDYFAGQALPEAYRRLEYMLETAIQRGDMPTPSGGLLVARAAYAMADAMIAESKR